MCGKKMMFNGMLWIWLLIPMVLRFGFMNRIQCKCERFSPASLPPQHPNGPCFPANISNDSLSPAISRSPGPHNFSPPNQCWHSFPCLCEPQVQADAETTPCAESHNRKCVKSLEKIRYPFRTEFWCVLPTW